MVGLSLVEQPLQRVAVGVARLVQQPRVEIGQERVDYLLGVPLVGADDAGWIKRGPTGVIGTNKKDATETVDHLLEDARAGLLTRSDSTGPLEELLAERGVEAVIYPGWTEIDELERSLGEAQGRPRVKLCTWDELLAAARG